MSVPGWLALALGAWLVAVVFICAILTAAKLADAAAAAAGPPAEPPLPLAALERLARDVRRELAVDQVLIVVCDRRAPGRAVAVAGAGVSPSLLGASLAPLESLAAAVAESGQSAIAAGHGPLDTRRAGDAATGDAAAVALAVPAGALAVARLDPAQPLTTADLQHLRAFLRRRGSTFRRPREPERAAGEHRTLR